MTQDPSNPPSGETVVGGVFDIADDVRAVCLAATRLVEKGENLLADIRDDGLHFRVTFGAFTIAGSVWANTDGD